MFDIFNHYNTCIEEKKAMHFLMAVKIKGQNKKMPARVVFDKTNLDLDKTELYLKRLLQ